MYVYQDSGISLLYKGLYTISILIQLHYTKFNESYIISIYLHTQLDCSSNNNGMKKKQAWSELKTFFYLIQIGIIVIYIISA